MREKIYFGDNQLFGLLRSDGTIWNEKGERIAYLCNELVYSKDGYLIGFLEKGRLTIKNNRTPVLPVASRLDKSGTSCLPFAPKMERIKRTRR
jgi:hypothetical protein